MDTPPMFSPLFTGYSIVALSLMAAGEAQKRVDMVIDWFFPLHECCALVPLSEFVTPKKLASSRGGEFAETHVDFNTIPYCHNHDRVGIVV
jgi:hypothetical protein